jgi:transcriptional antiterminator
MASQKKRIKDLERTQLELTANLQRVYSILDRLLPLLNGIVDGQTIEKLSLELYQSRSSVKDRLYS